MIDAAIISDDVDIPRRHNTVRLDGAIKRRAST